MPGPVTLTQSPAHSALTTQVSSLFLEHSKPPPAQGLPVSSAQKAFPSDISTLPFPLDLIQMPPCLCEWTALILSPCLSLTAFYIHCLIYFLSVPQLEHKR